MVARYRSSASRTGVRWKFAVVCALFVLGSFVFASCGGSVDGDDPSAGTDSSEPVTIRTGFLPGVQYAAFYVGEDQGFFADEGVRVENVAQVPDGSALVPSLLQGDVEVVPINTTALIGAVGRGLPLKAISGFVSASSDPTSDWAAIVAAKNSGIEQPGDLEGGTVAVNAVKTIAELATRASLEKKGVDTEQVELLEIPFPEMPQALQDGRVDAALVLEPFLTQSLISGARVIDRPLVGTQPGLSVVSIATSEEILAERGEDIDAFLRALERSFAYVEDHPGAARRAVTEHLDVPSEVAEMMTLPTWSSELDPADLAEQAELAQLYGVAEEIPDPVTDMLRDEG